MRVPSRQVFLKKRDKWKSVKEIRGTHKGDDVAAVELLLLLLLLLLLHGSNIHKYIRVCGQRNVVGSK